MMSFFEGFEDVRHHLVDACRASVMRSLSRLIDESLYYAAFY